MVTTVVRVRRTATADGNPNLTFAVDGSPADDRVLDLDPALPPISELSRFQSTPDADSTVIADAGSALHQRLTTHANMARALDDTLRTPVDRVSREVRIHIENIAKIAHNLPWEALLHPDKGFVALSQDLPFSRGVPPLSSEVVRTTDTFDGGLRFMAIIAAAGIPGGPQWRAIEQALRQWPADRRQCLILVDGIELRQQIDADALEGVRTALVPGSVEELVQQIGDFVPHMLHIFCHGQSDGGGVLEIATVNSTFGLPPLYLRPAPLASASRSTWLVALNACSSGAVNPDANTNSIACSLVEQGVPFVTSMRQIVEAGVVNKFAAAFLKRVIRDLKSDYEKDAPFLLRVAPAVMAARRTIMDTYGADDRLQRRYIEWTLPILCASANSFEIRPVTAISQQEATSTLAAIRALRSILSTGQYTDDQRRAIEDQINQLERLIV
jgi:hypothetical protein